MPQVWKLSPSDLTFLWSECRRCFYLKVVQGFPRPWAGMPRIFNQIDKLINAYFLGRSTAEISSDLPDGIVEYGERWVESEPISLPDRRSRCYIKGRFDAVIAFREASQRGREASRRGREASRRGREASQRGRDATQGTTYGVLDFKTTKPSPRHVPFYSRQLHAYAYALEHPAPGKLALAPVTELGLLCFEPSAIEPLPGGRLSYAGEFTWLACPKDYERFHRFLDEVLAVLDQPEPPASSPACVWCRYREEARSRGG
jgi:hypothetical protein